MEVFGLHELNIPDTGYKLTSVMLQSTATQHEVTLCLPESIHFRRKTFHLINSAENHYNS